MQGGLSDFGWIAARVLLRGDVLPHTGGEVYLVDIDGGCLGRLPVPFVWFGDALVYRRLCALEQFVRDDGIRRVGYGVGGFPLREGEPDYVGVGRVVWWCHPVCLRVELDGSADQSVGTGVEVALADVPCGGHRGSLRVLWHLRFIWYLDCGALL